MNTAVDISPPRPTSEINLPDAKISAREAFDLDVNMDVPSFSVRTEHVPDVDLAYKFDRETTLAILAGFAYNRRVMIQGYHGTGKSTHIEQVAARLNWPCIRVNLDSHISRIDLIGKDAIVLKDGKQITEFREGILPWALQHACALVFDEYDAGRPDVMFVIQRVLEVEGKLTLLDQNRVIRPHPSFRLFSTANTVGLGDTTGLYHGTQQINQGQMDRWNIVATLNYLPHAMETGIVHGEDGDRRVEGRRNQEAHREHGGPGRSYPCRLHQRRHLYRHVAAHSHHLGRECAHFRRCWVRFPCDVHEQMRRGRAQHRGGVLSTLLQRGHSLRRLHHTEVLTEPMFDTCRHGLSGATGQPGLASRVRGLESRAAGAWIGYVDQGWAEVPARNHERNQQRQRTG